MNEIWHMRCSFVCAGVHISISFIVFLYYIYIRYTIVMSCIGVYDFFSCTLKFQTMMYMKQNKKTERKKCINIYKLFSITNTCTKEYKQVEEVHLKCKLCMVSDMRLYMYTRIIDSAEFQAATFILLKPDGILSGFDFGKLFTMLLIM